MAGIRMPLGIEEIYKIDYFEAVCYGFMSAMIMQGVGRVDAAVEVQRWFGLDEDQAPKYAINRAYGRKLHLHKKVIKQFTIQDTEDEELIERIVSKLKNGR